MEIQSVEIESKNSSWTPRKIAITIVTVLSLLAGGGGSLALTSGGDEPCPEKCADKIETVRKAVIDNGKAISRIAGYLEIPE